MDNQKIIIYSTMTIIVIAILIVIIFGISKLIDNRSTKVSDLYVERVCIENHLYYYVPGFYKGGLAPVLDDNGIPIRCNR